MTDSRFAERTRVPVAQSQTEVKTLLKIAVYEDTEKSAVAFRMKDRFYRITVPVRAKARNPGQEERRSWRLVLLLIKAKLEAVREGATTFEREFLADMVTPDGRTVYEWTQEPLRLAYESGKMPDQLLLGG
jgi:NMD protein affecting ribosome stability and mRNA decay